MKKFFSLIALVGVIAACTPEQLETAFTVDGATAEVLVNVIDLRTGNPYSGQYTIAVDGTPINGNKISYSAGPNGILPEKAIIISVTGENLSDEQTFATPFRIPQVLAGGTFTGVAKVIVYEGTIYYEDWELDIDYDVVDESESFGYLDNSHYAVYTHTSPIDKDSQIGWYYNNTEYWLSGTVDYTVYSGEELLSETGCLYPGLEAAYELLMDDVAQYVEDGIQPYKLSKEIKVSAWAMWTVATVQFYNEWLYTMTAKNKTTGEEVLVGTASSLEVIGYLAQYYEQPYPLAPGHAHYHYGHGHGHGGDNAGGGISFNE